MSDKTIYKFGGTNIGGSNIEEIESRGNLSGYNMQVAA